MGRPQIDDPLWDEILQALRESRGRNRFRGRQTLLFRRRQIRLEGEAVGPHPPRGQVLIQVAAVPELCTLQVGGTRLALAQFASVREFVETAVHAARHGRDYLHTKMTYTTYK